MDRLSLIDSSLSLLFSLLHLLMQDNLQCYHFYWNIEFCDITLIPTIYCTIQLQPDWRPN